eukprot:9845348-Ditylum_brightwellii.AAC.1
MASMDSCAAKDLFFFGKFLCERFDRYEAGTAIERIFGVTHTIDFGGLTMDELNLFAFFCAF